MKPGIGPLDGPLDSDQMREEHKKFAAHVKGLGEELRAVYSAHYPLDDVPVKGKVILCSLRYSGYEGSTYQSKLLTDPTWLDAAVHLNRSILVTRDRHHKFLEGLTAYPRTDLGITLLHFILGS